MLETFLGYMTALVNALKMTYVNFAGVKFRVILYDEGLSLKQQFTFRDRG